MLTSFTRRVMLVGPLLAVMMCGLLSSQAVAQGDCNDPNVKCGKRQSTPAPAATTVKRTSTGRRPSRRPAPAQPAAKLQFQWGALKIDSDGKKKGVHIPALAQRDQFVLSVKIIESGYLYVIRQTSPDGDGVLLFPSRYYNRSDDRVQMGDEFILPDCSNPAISLSPLVANERLTLILSRNPIARLRLKPLPGGGLKVPKNFISELRNAPGQQESVFGGLEAPNTYVVEAAAGADKAVETLDIIKGTQVIKFPATAAAN